MALIDPLWVGHHPMYFCQFAASFLRCGARVIGLCPEPEVAMSDLSQAMGAESPSSLHGLVHCASLLPESNHLFSGWFQSSPFRTLAHWRNAADTLAVAEAACGLKADLVYFPYLDRYLRFLPFPGIPDSILNRRWSGLYLRNHHHGESPSLGKSLRMLAKGDSLFRSKSCQHIGVLDERFIPVMEEYCHKRITAYPDVTQTNLPDTPYPLKLDIQRRAAGRAIVGMIGLERRKGFYTLLQTAKLAREARLPYYFVCAGAIQLQEFDAAEQTEIRKLGKAVANGEIDNVFFTPDAVRIPSEADYNSLFSSFHIAWAAYEGFQGSSGTLSKAAAFEIPCIATSGECIGNRVRTYQLGITIREGSAEQALAAIPQLVSDDGTLLETLSPRYEEYREHHSQKRLDRILKDLLDSLG